MFSAGSDSSAWSPAAKARDSSAPTVLTAPAGGTVTYTFSTGTYTYTAPTPFNSTAVIPATTTGGGELHVLPQVAPTGPTQAELRAFTVLEDGKMRVALFSSSNLGLPLTTRITKLPTAGKLFD
eukprot:6882908-Prymnesium_polylepis.1